MEFSLFFNCSLNIYRNTIDFLNLHQTSLKHYPTTSTSDTLSGKTQWAPELAEVSPYSVILAPTQLILHSGPSQSLQSIGPGVNSSHSRDNSNQGSTTTGGCTHTTHTRDTPGAPSLGDREDWPTGPHRMGTYAIRPLYQN